MLAPVGSLSLREASVKYGVPIGTLSGWVSKGLIRKVREPERRGQPLLLVEADVAQVASAYRPGRGRWHGGALLNSH